MMKTSKATVEQDTERVVPHCERSLLAVLECISSWPNDWPSDDAPVSYKSCVLKRTPSRDPLRERIQVWYGLD